MRLKYQLFVILLVASATLIAALYAFNSWSFNRGFLNYISQSQQRSLRSFSDSLSDQYTGYGSWDWIVNNPSQWRRLSGHALRQPNRVIEKRANGLARQDNRLPATHSATEPNNRTERQPSPGDTNRNRPRPPPLVLADTDKQVLVGQIREGGSVQWLPIENNDVLIGFLGYAKAQRLPGQLDQVFAKQQKKSFALASFLMVGLSAVLAALLASGIVKPVVSLSKAVGTIRHGDYAQRVSIQRRDELGDLSRDVNQLAYTLEQNRTARRNWVAEISHELGTPVAILQGEIEAMQDGIRPLDNHALTSLHKETLRLSRLISDLHDLSLSDIGALGYKMAPVNFRSVLEERLAAAATQYEQTQLRVELNAPLTRYPILGDQQRLGQMIDNLLQNSLRYTDAGGTLQIDLTQQAGQLQLRWLDSAPGVDATNLPQLFDPLFRAEVSRNRNSGGAGLGLAIVKKIVVAHQGDITAAPSRLGGLEIKIDLPMQ